MRSWRATKRFDRTGPEASRPIQVSDMQECHPNSALAGGLSCYGARSLFRSLLQHSLREFC